MRLFYNFKYKTPEGKEIHLGIRRPSRLELDDADMMFSKFQSECIAKGILTKEMLLKSYKNFGGILSNSEEKEYSKIFASFVETQRKLDSAKTKKEKEALKKELEVFFQSLRQMEVEHEHLFNRTADVIARNKTINHLSLLLAVVNTGTDESPTWERLYHGDEYEERYSYFAELEEKNPDEANAILSKITLFVTFWYFSNSKDLKEEDFKAYDELTSKDFDEIIAP